MNSLQEAIYWAQVSAGSKSCHVILKSHHARQCYKLDITGFYCSLWTMFKYSLWLELWANDLIFVCNTSSSHDNHLCHIIYKSQNRWLSYGYTRTGFTEIYAQSLSADCAIGMVLVHDTLFCHDDHLYQIIFISDHAWQSSGSAMNKLHWSLCTRFKSWLWPWHITYMQKHGSCLQHIILSWWSYVPTFF